MKKEEIKKHANRLSNIFIDDDDKFIEECVKMEELECIALILDLAQLYYQIKTGFVSRDDGIALQEEMLKRA